MTIPYPIRIKICGLSRPEDIACANDVRPDFVGFVFAPASRRCITPERAAALRAALAPGIDAVGVFVDQPPEFIASLLAARTIDWAQLHGHESPDYIARLRALAPSARLIQAFSVRTPDDIARAAASPADRVLLDHGAGGTGAAFDWTLAAGFPRPYLLAGGITPDNAADAIRAARPWGLDASSSLETDRLKDPAKIRAFVSAIRACPS
ncbi:MAG: phosphoribosylanthranilate isomerase [Kiritimatiellae bacterium]|nr:phosphoribosylanthranilate isomerase [Kiritimatiellia bacterium]